MPDQINSNKDSKFAVSHSSLSIDYEQLFRAREDYIISCDQERIYLFNLKRKKEAILEKQGGLLFSDKQKLCRIHQLH
jgi:hypothetical protein